MSANMDRSLDDILSEKRTENPRRGGGGRRGRDNDRGGDRGPRRSNTQRNDYPRDGIRKSYREDSRNLDTEWVHDRYEDDNRGPRRGPRGRRDDTPPERIDSSTSKLKVENIHYELTEEDLDGLFKRIGPVLKLNLRYDRAGRSEGTAFVVYEYPEDAREAIREFDGANANGQPIRLSLVSNDRGPRARNARNPFDTAVMPGRPLSERVTMPSGRSRSLSPTRNNQDMDDATAKGIDRYVPGTRSRSPMPARRRGGAAGGRRPGARREQGRNQDQGERRGGNAGNRGNRRTKKTQEELDAEMADYFGGGGESNEAAGGTTNTAAPAGDDVDMIE